MVTTNPGDQASERIPTRLLPEHPVVSHLFFPWPERTTPDPFQKIKTITC